MCVFYLHLLASTPVYFHTSYHVQEDTQPRGISGAICASSRRRSPSCKHSKTRRLPKPPKDSVCFLIRSSQFFIGILREKQRACNNHTLSCCSWYRVVKVEAVVIPTPRGFQNFPPPFGVNLTLAREVLANVKYCYNNCFAIVAGIFKSLNFCI